MESSDDVAETNWNFRLQREERQTAVAEKCWKSLTHLILGLVSVEAFPCDSEERHSLIKAFYGA